MVTRLTFKPLPGQHHAELPGSGKTGEKFGMAGKTRVRSAESSLC